MLKRQFPTVGDLLYTIYFENDILVKSSLNIKKDNV